jgi:DNA-binding phage protein
MTDTEAVFEQLKHEIDRARRTGMSVQAVARQAGLCNSTLHLWLNGKAKAPRLRTMIRVAEALGKLSIDRRRLSSAFAEQAEPAPPKKNGGLPWSSRRRVTENLRSSRTSAL